MKKVKDAVAKGVYVCVYVYERAHKRVVQLLCIICASIHVVSTSECSACGFLCCNT